MGLLTQIGIWIGVFVVKTNGNRSFELCYIENISIEEAGLFNLTRSPIYKHPVRGILNVQYMYMQYYAHLINTSESPQRPP